MITYLTPTAGIATVAWSDTGDRLAIIHANGEWYLSWNGPLYTPLEVIEAPRLLAYFRAAGGEFAGDPRPEVGALYRRFEGMVNAICEGVQTR